MSTADQLSLFDFATEQQIAIDELAREQRLPVQLVEDAAEAIGIGIHSKGGGLLRAIALSSGWGTMRRTLAELAADPLVDSSESYVAQMIDLLIEDGVLHHTSTPGPVVRRRGRNPEIHCLTICWTEVRRVRRVAMQWEADEREKAAAPKFDLIARFDREDGEIWARSERDLGEISPRFGRDLEVTPYIPINPFTPPPPPSENEVEAVVVVEWSKPSEDRLEERWEEPSVSRCSEAGPAEPKRSSPWSPAVEAAVVEAVEAAGVTRSRVLMREAVAAGMTAAELIDDAYVVQHHEGLGPGALFDRVRNHAWPASGVPPAAVLRDARRERANRIRDATVRDAPPGAIPGAVEAVAYKRLLAAGLADEATAAESDAFTRLRSPVRSLCPVG